MSNTEIAVSIAGPVGTLEGRYLDQGAQGVVLIAHPNPVKGGTMQNKVITTLQRVARDAGLTTLRFNYRGVGQSQGQHDMAQGEVDDALAALEWLQAKYPVAPVYLLGFSFGGFVVAALAERLAAQGISPHQLYMVAPAVSRVEPEALAALSTQLTVIQPMADEVIEPELVLQWTQQLSIPHELIQVADCSHFFHGQLTVLKQLVAERL
ncbi:alpha/beta hydrolase [Thiopseudomonas alkaliphila]|uniref:alpha/beta hydrolase n=1 Tax=Thiopseudomonas alkaliphila TaxID=1697053 RepID=UPI0025773DE3|nr:alpha/beta fold hydrolase [Thiopseudomonas alkaliphila]MDM1708945.1 alpha/beta fold hydrolase [Thiopseudomonas alkaliphila]